ncbi:hypothetical protein JCM10207_002705 [Rhodosporidiobolus poonsookiae]
MLSAITYTCKKTSSSGDVAIKAPDGKTCWYLGQPTSWTCKWKFTLHEGGSKRGRLLGQLNKGRKSASFDVLHGPLNLRFPCEPSNVHSSLRFDFSPTWNRQYCWVSESPAHQVETFMLCPASEAHLPPKCRQVLTQWKSKSSV